MQKGSEFDSQPADKLYFLANQVDLGFRSNHPDTVPFVHISYDARGQLGLKPTCFQNPGFPCKYPSAGNFRIPLEKIKNIIQLEWFINQNLELNLFYMQCEAPQL